MGITRPMLIPACRKNVHILDGCSYSIGSGEGYGSKKICLECHQKKNMSSQTQIAKEMQYENVWAKKTKTKRSVYLKPNPLFSLVNNTKKQAIGLLKNGNQFKTPFYINKQPVQFFNTCAPDALALAIAGADAYNPALRAYYDEQPDLIVQIGVSLAKKLVNSFYKVFELFTM